MYYHGNLYIIIYYTHMSFNATSVFIWNTLLQRVLNIFAIHVCVLTSWFTGSLECTLIVTFLPPKFDDVLSNCPHNHRKSHFVRANKIDDWILITTEESFDVFLIKISSYEILPCATSQRSHAGKYWESRRT